MHKFVAQVQGEAEKHLNNLHAKVRAAVSRDKFRFQDGTFDLDLTYITDRIMGMRKEKEKEKGRKSFELSGYLGK